MITYTDVLARSKKPTDMSGHLLRLYKLTVDLPVRDKVIAELGIRGGESTTALLAAVNDSGGHLFSVDIKDCSQVYKGEPNWTFILGDDMEVAKKWNRPIDHLFIDTTHTFEHTLAELREWGRWVKTYGIITLHDTHAPNYLGVMKAIKWYLADNPSFMFKDYPECFGLGVVQKIP